DTLTLIPQYNQHNEDVYVKSINGIPYELKTKSKEKFQKSVILWGGISYQGLFPKKSPIFIDEWLKLIRLEGDDRHKKMYFIGDRYAQFIPDTIAEKGAEELGDLQNFLFQDDQDRKQRMQVALDDAKRIFINRIEPIDCAAKPADVWLIKSVWGSLKEKLRGREYTQIEQLKTDIKKEQNKFSISLCQRMIDKMPARLKLVIDQGGNQIRKD
ncbi:unnamed protein product, partial [Rotaria sp. Silwood2]